MRRLAMLAPLALTIEVSLPGDGRGAGYPFDTAALVEGNCDMEPIQ